MSPSERKYLERSSLLKKRDAGVITEEEKEKLRQIELSLKSQQETSDTFFGRDVPKVAVGLAEGVLDNVIFPVVC